MFRKLPYALFFTLLFIASLQTHADIQKESKERIISAGGSITELIFALDLGGDIVAVDISSSYPQDMTDKLPRIGYYRQLSAEGLLSLEPSMLIAAKGAGPEAVLEQVAEAGVTVKLFKQNEYSLDAWQDLVTRISTFFGKKERAHIFIDEKLAAIKASQAQRQYKKDSLNAILLMSAGQRGLMVAGKNTMPDFLFELTDINNVAQDINGYKTITNESLIQSKVDFIIMPAHVIKSSGGKKAICNNPTLLLAFNGDCNLLIMDPLLALGMGSRIDTAIKTITHYANNIAQNSAISADKVIAK